MSARRVPLLAVTLALATCGFILVTPRLPVVGPYPYFDGFVILVLLLAFVAWWEGLIVAAGIFVGLLLIRPPDAVTLTVAGIFAFASLRECLRMRDQARLLTELADEGARAADLAARREVLINAAPYPIITISADPPGEVITWNDAAARLFGYTAQQAVGRNVADLIIPLRLRPAHLHALGRRIEARTPLHRTVLTTAHDASGREFAVRVTLAVVAVPGPGGRLYFTAFPRPLRSGDDQPTAP